MLIGQLGYKGERGFSAYEIAVQNGYIGTEQDWLATLGTSSHFEQDIETYTTTEADEDTFALPSIYTSSSFVEVYVNGLKLTEAEYTLDTTNNEIVLTTPLEVVGTIVEIVLITMSTNNLPITDTIDSTSTNDTAAGTKAVYDALQLKVDTSDYTTAMAGKINTSDFAIISGDMTLDANTFISQNEWTTTGKNIDYPTGFTKDNCVVVSFGLKATPKEFSYGYTVGTPSSSTVLFGAYPRTINLDTDNIVIRIGNYATDSMKVYYKIVLMKIGGNE